MAPGIHGSVFFEIRTFFCGLPLHGADRITDTVGLDISGEIDQCRLNAVTASLW
jgi:hypothetical protein